MIQTIYCIQQYAATNYILVNKH